MYVCMYVCHLEILYTLYRVHNLCTLLFYSQMHFFNLLIDLTNNLYFHWRHQTGLSVLFISIIFFL